MNKVLEVDRGETKKERKGNTWMFGAKSSHLISYVMNDGLML